MPLVQRSRNRLASRLLFDAALPNIQIWTWIIHAPGLEFPEIEAGLFDSVLLRRG